MKNENKYQFTKEQSKELEFLRKLFDNLMKENHYSLWNIINKKDNLTKDEVIFMENELKFFDSIILISRYKDKFLRMVELTELESKYAKQEFIKQMLESEQYEILSKLKKQKHLREFFE